MAARMDSALVLSLGVFAGGILAFLAQSGLRVMGDRRGRRGLAAALIGETVAILRIFEVHDVLAKLDRAAERTDTPFDFGGFALPDRAIFKACADKLPSLPRPLPRQLAAFHVQIEDEARELQQLATTDIESRPEQARRTAAQLRETLDLADQLLRGLRPLVSIRRPASITRA